MFEDGVAEAVANHIGCRAARRPWGGRPNRPGRLIANVKRLARRILDRIVSPRSEPELVRVLKPGVSTATFGNDCSEIRIRQHINPWRRGDLIWLKRDDILVPIASEADRKSVV